MTTSYERLSLITGISEDEKAWAKTFFDDGWKMTERFPNAPLEMVLEKDGKRIFVSSLKRGKIMDIPKQGDANKGLSFGDAIDAAIAGKRVARAGWNGKGMWISYSPGCRSLDYTKFWSDANFEWAKEQPNGCAEVLPCLTMKTADDKILMGWLASQTDMVAKDWEIV